MEFVCGKGREETSVELTRICSLSPKQAREPKLHVGLKIVLKPSAQASEVVCLGVFAALAVGFMRMYVPEFSCSLF